MENLRDLASTYAKLRASLNESKQDLSRVQRLHEALVESLQTFWTEAHVKERLDSAVLWKESLDLVASGRIPTVIAQSEQELNKTTERSIGSNFGDGRQYTRWLIQHVKLVQKTSKKINTQPSKPPDAQLCSKALSLGYIDEAASCLVDDYLEDEDSFTCLTDVFASLSPYEQRRLFIALIESLRRKLFFGDQLSLRSDLKKVNQKHITASAYVLRSLIAVGSSDLVDHFISTLLKQPATSTTALRACVAALDPDQQETLLEKSWQCFADRLQIRHAPVLQQEAIIIQICLLLGASHRRDPMQTFVLAHSSTHTGGVSEHLKSSSPRVRFLGMALSVVVSGLSDKPENQIKFDFDEDEVREVVFLRALTSISDDTCSMTEAIKVFAARSSKRSTKVSPIKAVRPSSKPKVQTIQEAPAPKPVISILEEVSTASVISRIQEINSDDEEDEDLKPLPKPANDSEDSEEDATLVERDKPKPPIYIRDIISGLQDSDNHVRFELTLQSASSLITRKAGFGKEISDALAELSTLLIGLRDPFDLDEFEDHRRAALAALLSAAPEDAAPFYTDAYWHGDHSANQRVAILQAIGLTAQRLSGYASSETEQATPSFASEQLSERLHKLYLSARADPSTLRALDDSTPAAAAVATASNTRGKGKQRVKLIRNDLSKMMAQAFFFPLLSGWHLRSQTSTTHTRILLPSFIQTLTLLLRMSGRTSQHLPLLLSEYWAFLHALRVRAAEDQAILESVLSGLLSVFHFTDDKREMAQQRGKQLLETYEWAHFVFERTSEADEGGRRVKGLAAALLIAAKEVVEGYQRLLLGDMVGTL